MWGALRTAVSRTAAASSSRSFLQNPASRSGFMQQSRFFSGIPARHGTTILCVKKDNKIVLIGDGQITQGSITVKPNAKKIRRLQSGNNEVVLGFAGSTADCLSLVDRLEGKLDEYPGQLQRACVELAKSWRTDRYLRHLEAVLIVCDQDVCLEVTGNGDVLEPNDGIIAVGSGGAFANAAARALKDIPGLSAMEIATKAMNVAADMCIHTNHNFSIEEMTIEPKKEGESLEAPVHASMHA